MLIYTLLFVNLLIPGELHEFHLSKCQIDYVQEEQSLQISLHLFIDDLEETLRNGGQDDLFICTDKEAPEAEQYIVDYLRDHFKIKVDQQAVSFSFLGKEVSEDLIGVWCYLEISNVAPFSNLLITNDVLIETFADQKNIISVSGPNQQRNHYLLQEGKTQVELNF